MEMMSEMRIMVFMNTKQVRKVTKPSTAALQEGHSMQVSDYWQLLLVMPQQIPHTIHSIICIARMMPRMQDAQNVVYFYQDLRHLLGLGLGVQDDLAEVYTISPIINFVSLNLVPLDSSCLSPDIDTVFDGPAQLCLELVQVLVRYVSLKLFPRTYGRPPSCWHPSAADEPEPHSRFSYLICVGYINYFDRSIFSQETLLSWKLVQPEKSLAIQLSSQVHKEPAQKCFSPLPLTLINSIIEKKNMKKAT